VIEPNSEEPQPARDPRYASVTRSSALGLLIGGAVCLYLGFSLLVDAPGSADEDTTKAWFAADHVFQWLLRILGAGFLLIAAWTLTGQRSALLLSAAVEAGFAALMVAMAVETTFEARADGLWDFNVILLLILAVIGVTAGRRSWVLYAATGRARSSTPTEGEHRV